jgi:hypothetical protein
MALSAASAWAWRAPRPPSATPPSRSPELSIEVLTSYELADIARISEGYDLGLDLRTPIRA